MKNIIAIPCHNQNLNDCFRLLSKQTIKPECILILNDHSDTLLFDSFNLNIKVFNCEKYGRAETRNRGFIEFLKLDGDNLIFIDGDCIPENEKFIENYEFYLNSYDLIFGTRIHSKINKNITLVASDLLTRKYGQFIFKKRIRL